jgi:hypothetical protein
MSYFQPHVITPSDWNNQINQPEDVEPPLAERFNHFDPGDILYIEGRVSTIEPYHNSSKIIIQITDDIESSNFVLPKNYSNINIGDNVFLKVEIIGHEASDNSFILSGNDSRYFREEAVLLDIEKDYFSFKSTYFFGGVFSFLIGTIVIIKFLKIKKMDREIQEEDDSLDQEDR